MDQPTISFVVATLNEEHTIEDCLRSLLNQRYPAERIEVAVVDGGSTDRTREVVARMVSDDPRIRLLHNPAGIAPHAFNIGVTQTTGKLISLQSAHGTADPDYAAVLASAFRTSGAALVGGREEAAAGVNASPMAEAIVRATSSPLGLGSARYHYSDKPGWVDTASPGAYRRDLFDEIGGFDESLVRNQDDEFHLRARLAGHRMWFEPRLRTSYRPRRTLRALWRQYFEYGWWRSVTLLKHRRVASVRHLVPAMLVAGLASGPVLAAVAPRRRRWVGQVWAGGVAAWLAVLVASTIRECNDSPRIALRVPVAVACLHLAYGVGFWRGLLFRAARSGRAARDRRASAAGGS
jgi:succinoglycan biosynthesis protein ExoA